MPLIDGEKLLAKLEARCRQSDIGDRFYGLGEVIDLLKSGQFDAEVDIEPICKHCGFKRMFHNGTHLRCPHGTDASNSLLEFEPVKAKASESKAGSKG